MRRAGPACVARTPGPALALLYVAVAAATGALLPGARVLFDGFAPPPPYNYVSPPPELASSNFPPRPARTSVVLDAATGTAAVNVSTEDAQALVTLPAGAIAPNAEDTAVAVELLPLAPSGLGALPPDLRPVGNAYQLGLAYQPSGTAVGTVATGATVALTGATPGDTLLFSADGQSWQRVAGRPFGSTHGMTGPVQGPGYYLVAASPAVTVPTTAGGGGGRGGGGTASLVVGVVLVAVGLGGWVAYLVQRKRERARKERERQQRRQQARRRKR